MLYNFKRDGYSHHKILSKVLHPIGKILKDILLVSDWYWKF